MRTAERQLVAADPRRAAFDVLRAVDAADSYANLELSRLIRARGLSGRDASFTTELVSGTLRMRAAYDAIIDSLVSRSLDPPVRDALRLGCHQLLSMRVPDHAAVTTTVSLVRGAIGHQPAGLVNAVLRRVGSRSFADWMEHLDAPQWIRTSHPAWVVDVFAEALGVDRCDELSELLAADNEAPRVTLVARPGLISVEELDGSRHPASPYAVELAGGDPGAIAAVRDGRAGVQDAGSQLVALALAATPVGGLDTRWLDLCAGPGGKAALLGALALRDGATVLANERQLHRAELVRAGVRALPAGTVTVVVGDGTRPAWPAGSFDRVLVDAPCTGFGALRRRPEARWRRSPQDLEDLVPLQAALLHAALDSTRPGGVVGYATCSPAVAETAGVVKAVLAARPGVILEDTPALAPWVRDAASEALPGALQLWPHRHHTDAMFLAVLRLPERP